ncbi:efflux RND transporter periplasmic adaptor subunit [Terriglobus saanensis]|uniref:efflux RND transporter periplasmic adaptor subunit n=1 Tax=Terriglobus saanensis TaxID=870903 RepID=UPI0001E50458|nr:efflux RND transporter periplasmic adaptor subunit [Terriglobus saanensis]
MISGMQRAADEQAENKGRRIVGRGSTKLWVAVGIAATVLVGAWLRYAPDTSGRSVEAHPTPFPQVVVSKPLIREFNTRIGFLGQFSAVNQIELRAQVGGKLTGIFFKDGDIVHSGDLLFTIEPRQYEIKLAEATAQLDVATARLLLADQQLGRAKELERGDAGTVENVDQRTSDQQTARASVEGAKAWVRDAQFDLEHCRIKAPFTGRIGTHLVSVGNLISGSRTAASPTTLLATLVSLDPIHLDFDMSESDFLAFSKHRSLAKNGPLHEKIDISLGNEDRYARQGVLDFMDNTLDRSSGTIHARATVRNPISL